MDIFSHYMTEFEGFLFTPQSDTCQNVKKGNFYRLKKHHFIDIHYHCTHSRHPMYEPSSICQHDTHIAFKTFFTELNDFSYHIWNSCCIWQNGVKMAAHTAQLKGESHSLVSMHKPSRSADLKITVNRHGHFALRSVTDSCVKSH